MNVHQMVRKFHDSLLAKCGERDPTVGIQVMQTNLLQGDGFDFIIYSESTGKREVYNLVYENDQWNWQNVWFV